MKRLRWGLVGAGVLALVAALAIAVVALQPTSSAIGEASVDAGFARDMAVHHAQAVQMASYARDHSPTPEVQRLAAEIAAQQQLEAGQLQGWLEAWGLSRMSSRAPMSWMPMSNHSGMQMDAAGAMPGMATPAELDGLLNMTGGQLEVRFLQLMIRHHQGGLPMAQYAARHAESDYVRSAATSMALSQTSEVDLMAHYLQARGGTELPTPN